MNLHINQLVKSLLQKDSIEQCSLQELQQFADSNPHFGAAQLLLTKKLKTENSDRYNDQLQKTFLFFHNPLWVEHLLNETGNAIVNPAVKKPQAVETAASDATVAAGITEQTTPLAIIAAPTAASVTDMALAEISDVQETEPLQPALMQTENAASAEQAEAVAPAPQPAAEKTEENNLTNPAFATVAVKDDLLFEPYHTVDYFASQGIKLKEEDKGTDKFSQQLRSFTDWLKTLKKVPATEIAKQPETGTEKKVEQMAAHSLQDEGVVTETMAEVWEKQGNTSKAIDLYTKLSLLEPGKSAYFAAKIEELKKQL